MKVVRNLALIGAAAAFLYPVVVLVTISLQHPSNYARAWNEAGLGRALLNSTLIVAATLVCVIFVGSLAAYGLARAAPRLGYRLYLLFLLGLAIPSQLALVPLYQAVQAAGLLGTRTALVAVYVGAQLPITIFLYTGFLRALPREYNDAALSDGATHLQAYAHVIFPLLRPVTGVVAVINALFVWNDFLTPLLYLSGSGKETVPVAVYTFVGQFGTDWGPVFAAIVLATVPLMVIIGLVGARRARGGIML